MGVVTFRCAPSGLSPEKLDRLNRELLRLHYDNEVGEYQRGLYCLALIQRDGPHTAAELGTRLRFETLKDYEDWIDRLRGFPAYLEQARELLAEPILQAVRLRSWKVASARCAARNTSWATSSASLWLPVMCSARAKMRSR